MYGSRKKYTYETCQFVTSLYLCQSTNAHTNKYFQFRMDLSDIKAENFYSFFVCATAALLLLDVEPTYYEICVFICVGRVRKFYLFSVHGSLVSNRMICGSVYAVWYELKVRVWHDQRRVACFYSLHSEKTTTKHFEKLPRKKVLNNVGINSIYIQFQWKEPSILKRDCDRAKIKKWMSCRLIFRFSFENLFRRYLQIKWGNTY